MPEIFFELKELHVKSVLYRKKGCYDVKKLFERVWEPSALVAHDTGKPRHLCKRFYWSHVGLGSSPIWFIWPRFPGWIQKEDEVKAGVPQTLPGGPVSSRAEARGKEVAVLKQGLDEELSRLLF